MAKTNPFMEMIAKKKAGDKPAKKDDKKAMPKFAKGGSVGATKMGAVKTAAPSRDGVAVKGKTKGTMIKMRGAK